VLKRLLVLTVCIATFGAVSLMPVSASADTFLKCPPGTTNVNYCTKVVLCVVPNLKGKTVPQANRLLRAHDCRRGRVRRVTGHPKGIIFKTKPKAGSVRRRNAKVTLYVGKGHKKHH
jgi:hypothetical protein